MKHCLTDYMQFSINEAKEYANRLRDINIYHNFEIINNSGDIAIIRFEDTPRYTIRHLLEIWHEQYEEEK